jgi:hypothetical protein
MFRAEEMFAPGGSVISAFRPTLGSTEDGFSIFRGVVSFAQKLMGLTSGGVDVKGLPTGGFVETILEPNQGGAVQVELSLPI